MIKGARTEIKILLCTDDTLQIYIEEESFTVPTTVPTHLKYEGFLVKIEQD